MQCVTRIKKIIFNHLYNFKAAINESGLGVLSWWDQQNQGGEEGDGNEDEDNVEYENDEDGEGAYEE